MVAGLAAKKVATEYILILAAAIVCVGTGLMSSLPTHSHLWPGIYGYEIIVGLGLGLASPPYFMLLGTSIAEKDISVGTGALNMMRTLGGCVAVAICTAIHREYTSDRLTAYLSPEQITSVQTSSAALTHMPDAIKNEVARVFGGSYNRQFLIMLAFTVFNVLVTVVLAIVRKRAGVFGEMPQRKEGNEFYDAAEKTADEKKLPNDKEKETTDLPIATSTNDSDEILATPIEAGKGKL